MYETITEGVAMAADEGCAFGLPLFLQHKKETGMWV